MPFNVTTEIGGLFGFLRKYGALFQEIKEILKGFTTETSGVYNPVNFPDRWKNVKGKPYKETEFTVNELSPLTVIGTNSKTKKTRLPILFNHVVEWNRENLQINIGTSLSGITNITALKSNLYKNKISKLQILTDCNENLIKPITINTSMTSISCTPLSVMTWLRSKIQAKFGVCHTLTTKNNDKLKARTYITEDLGTISDLELLDIIKEVELVAG